MAKKLLAALTVVATTAFSANAFGNVVTRIDTSRVVDLDEVIVVSQPKENLSLRRQPTASSVLTETELRRINATSLTTLSMYVPSLTVPAYGSRYTSSFYVRGIGSRSGDPSVGLYYDNVPIVSKAAYNRHLYQVDRIDVLRGPQATLYGMNAEAGLLRVYTKNPMSYQGTDVRLGMGTGLYANAEVAKFHRPSNHFAFSVAAFYNGLGGFFDNQNLDDKADLSNEAGGRMRFIFTPSKKWTFDLTAEYQYTNQNAFAYGEYDNASNTFSDPSTTFMNGYRRQLVTTGLTASYALPKLLISSTTSYQYLIDLMQMDQDYLPQDYMRLEQRQKQNALTEELSMRSRWNKRWRHTSGLFFSYLWTHTNAPVSFGDDMNRMIVSNMGMPAYIAQGITVTDNWVPGDFKTPQLNVGVYHESSLQLTDRFTVTVGLRYDHQKVSIDYNSNAQFLLSYNIAMQGRVMQGSHSYSSAFIGSSEESYDQLLPKFALTYNLDCGNIYATVSKGFRSGGYNLQMFSDIFKTEQTALGQQLMGLMTADMNISHTAEDYSNVNNTITYKPEVSWNYEVGSHINLFAGKVHADLSAFLMQIRDQQLSMMAGNYGYGRMMVNAGRTASYGIEAALRGSAVGDRLSWGATYSYTHSTFRDYTEQDVSYRGNRVPFVPAHAFSALCDYRFDICPNATLRSVTIGANVSGNGETYWDTENLYKQKLYATVGAHMKLDLGNVGINLWGRNITNSHYNTFLVNSSVDGQSRSFAQRGNPWQIGVDVDLHW